MAGPRWRWFSNAGSNSLIADYFGAHRDRVLYVFAIAAAVFYLPFTIIEFIDGRTLIGIGSAGILGVLWADAIAVWLGKPPPLRMELILVPLLPDLILAIWQQGGQPGLWCYPMVMGFYFVLFQRNANLVTALIVATVGIEVWFRLDHFTAVRMVFTLTLMAVIGNMMIYVIRDQQERLIELATRDALTGAFNRRHLDQAIEAPLERHRRSGTLATVLALDLDHFKKINDRYGHGAGDRVLKGFVEMVQSRIRRVDVLFRIGGEEFLVLVPDAREAEGAMLAEHLRQRVEAAILLEQQPVTISVGVAEVKENDTPATWISRADEALYRAKQEGRNRRVLWSGAEVPAVGAGMVPSEPA